jgi:hypothetical protein
MSRFDIYHVNDIGRLLSASLNELTLIILLAAISLLYHHYLTYTLFRQQLVSQLRSNQIPPSSHTAKDSDQPTGLPQTQYMLPSE